MISRKLAPKDQTIIYRLVGFYEYLKALEQFDALLQKANEYELAAIDELIKYHDEFAIYTNLTRKIQKAPSALSNVDVKRAGDKQNPASKEDYERRGLAWVMALARLEVGAMFATYTKVASPFEVVRPSFYEMKAYRNLLEDGMRTHYWSLAGDPALQRVIAESGHNPNAETMAYVRRLTAARKFHEAVGLAGGDQLTPSQVSELRKWGYDLGQLQQGLVKNVKRYLSLDGQGINQSDTQVDEKTQTRSINQGRACLQQLEGERYELQTGKAFVTTEKIDRIQNHNRFFRNRVGGGAIPIRGF